MISKKHTTKISIFLLVILLIQYPVHTISSSSYYGSSISVATEYNHRDATSSSGSSTLTLPKLKRNTFLSRNNKKLFQNNDSLTSTLVSVSSVAMQKRKDMVTNYEEEEKLPSIEEMRASLGPIGRTIASAVEVGVVTAGSFMSGAVLGYTLGGFMAIPSLFGKLPPPDAQQAANIVNRGPIGNFHNKAATQAISWASLSASFSGFHALSRVMRNKEDKWNGIIGSAATGAFLNRKGDARAMAQGAISYASVTYLLDFAFGTNNKNNNSINKGNNNGDIVERNSPEFGFTDAPYDE